jgi:hypothetical protein
MADFVYTFLNMQSKLSELLGDSNTSTDDMFPLARRKFVLNMAEVQFARDSKLLKNYATGTIASSELALPKDWIENYIFIVNNKAISNDKEVALADWERFYSVAEESPYFYYWEFSGTRKFKFIGSTCNGQTYYLYYFAKPTTELDADGDTSVFPLEYREAPIYWAAAELLQQIGKTELATLYKNNYAQYVMKGIAEGEKLFINKEYPRPDIIGDTISDVDRQGHGFPY